MSTAKTQVSRASNQVNQTAREIWLAGLGAVARAQSESNKLFDALVAEGTEMETRARKEVTDRVTGLRRDVEGRIKQVRDTAAGKLGQAEKVFEERVARVLSRLGVPTADEIQALSRRVSELSREVNALNAGTAKAAKSQEAA